MYHLIKIASTALIKKIIIKITEKNKRKLFPNFSLITKKGEKISIFSILNIVEMYGAIKLRPRSSTNAAKSVIKRSKTNVAFFTPRIKIKFSIFFKWEIIKCNFYLKFQLSIYLIRQKVSHSLGHNQKNL